MMAHYRLVGSLLVGVIVALILTACAGTAPAPIIEPPPLVISAAGIGSAEIGEPPSAVLDELTSLIGGPDADSRWIDADSSLYGECPAEQIRAVGWGSLYLIFTSDETVTPDNEHIVGRFFSYSYGFDFSRNEGGTDPRELGLTTAAGISLGSTRSELRLAYGDTLTESYDAVADVWKWELGATQPTSLRGLLSGPGAEAAVTLIERVPGCGDV